MELKKGEKITLLENLNERESVYCIRGICIEVDSNMDFSDELTSKLYVENGNITKIVVCNDEITRKVAEAIKSGDFEIDDCIASWPN